LKQRQYRPRVVIIDDPEDIKWVEKKENRDATEKWLNSTVIPGLDKMEAGGVGIFTAVENTQLIENSTRQKRSIRENCA